MSIYTYQESSLIDKITIRKTAGGGTRAYLYANESVTPEQADKLKKTLSEAHMACVPSESGGKSCLEVRGCKDIKLLESVLKPSGFIQGDAKADHTDNSKFSIMETVRHNMVAIYGVVNIIADFGMLAYGHMKQKLSPGKDAWEEKASGIAYSAGSIAFTAFGRGDKSDFHSSDIALALRKELLDRGLHLSDDSAAATFINARQNQGFLRKASNKLMKGGSDVGNLATGTAGGFILLGALNNKGKNETNTRIVEGVLGTTTLLSGYGAALINEKAPDPKNPPTTFLGQVKEKVQEKPNRLAGYGYMVSTVMHGWEAFVGHRDAHIHHPNKTKYAKTAYALRGAFAGLNLMAEVLLAMAPKGHGSGNKSNAGIEETAVSLVADAIMRQPEEKRDQLIHELSHNFLARADMLATDADRLQGKLFERVHELKRNPWLGAVSASNAVAAAGEADRKWADEKLKQVTRPVQGMPTGFIDSMEKRARETAENKQLTV